MPYETRHLFSPKEGGNTEETTVDLELYQYPLPPSSTSEITMTTSSTTSTLSNQSNLRPDEINLVSPKTSQPQLSGIWASRAHFPGTPLEPRDRNATEVSLRRNSRHELPDRVGEYQSPVENQYSGQPLLGAWATPGSSGATVVRSSRGVSPGPPSMRSHSAGSSVSSGTGSIQGARTPPSGKLLKHSVSGPVRQSPPVEYHAQRNRLVSSDHFNRRDFSGVGNSDNYRHSPRGRPREYQPSRGQWRPRRMDESPLRGDQGLNRGGGRRDDYSGYQRSFSDTTALQPVAGESPSPRKPGSEPTRRGRSNRGSYHGSPRRV